LIRLTDSTYSATSAPAGATAAATRIKTYAIRTTRAAIALKTTRAAAASTTEMVISSRTTVSARWRLGCSETATRSTTIAGGYRMGTKAGFGQNALRRERWCRIGAVKAKPTVPTVATVSVNGASSSSDAYGEEKRWPGGVYVRAFGICATATTGRLIVGYRPARTTTATAYGFGRVSGRPVPRLGLRTRASSNDKDRGHGALPLT
jgi:hypothetical protein